MRAALWFAMPLARSMAAAFAVALLAVVAAAQRQWLDDRQRADGRWTADEAGQPGAADLRVTAWMLLAIVGDGSTLHAGPYREPLQAGCRWLRAQQDDAGRFGLRADPDWLLDHAFATCAFAEAVTASGCDEPIPAVVTAIDALTTALVRTRPAAGVEARLWSRVVVLALRRGADRRLGAAAERLDAAARALPAPSADAGCERLRAAADLLGDLLADDAADSRAPNELLPTHWPEDELADPLHTFYATALAFRRGGEGYRAAQQRLLRLVKAQRRLGESGGTWPAVGRFGAAHGEVGTTAVSLLSMECYYRYCKLALFDRASRLDARRGSPAR